MTKEEIKDLVNLFAETNISKIKIKDENGFEIELEKDIYPHLENPVCPPAATPQPINVNVVNEAQHNALAHSNNPSINSPMVGTFYQAPSPGATPFVKVGSMVKKGDVIAIIEAMKIMNEIEAEFNCRIIEVLVADGQPVEFGMPLFVVEKL
ncbi:acetyl-CoA carboxylase biotin carboxyl carrier protein [Campylobacter cuniculorum]|uniref:Biotin carboxyl carrier protein of acetyl-CoA carboxylase n=2 Tax=Campylobacter cuniculorum TaxID=374106 RepID=A0A1W6BVP6_9BACT|nr:acetyl-CoA carboxylase biotin carboxyl carrier protein [Campylobacter cuniculorum]ARJ56176.1 acetyl-CoA carboxylase, biotin carboxyl carrier protein [Campylobacter cuniculorum DSM 23162 = LMG 24588]QOR03668.1 acetyl-CoA carboxylase biotin carboxyl carrier protein [Campylobacter cuniculorum]